MPSIIEGFNYDIFISYRQKDNKHDGWVSRFVEDLKGELESTFKEDISVYFDENPHDRLQETHNVDKSLEGKLKCLIFIPILSQTYCDPNSYAWQNEFLAFLRLAEQDRFGRDVNLRSGNVSSRILPVKIHDLEPEDVKLFEKETGAVLRALDFVFKTSAGVNRPLKAAEDHPNDNLNKTFYNDQINKVANAVKEIMLGLKFQLTEQMKETSLGEIQASEIRKERDKVKAIIPQILPKNKALSGILIAALPVIIILILFYPKIFPSGKKVTRDPDGRISIAITNFDNQTNDTTLNWLEMGIPELIRNNLAGSKEFHVQNTQTMNELYESLRQVKDASVIPSLSREAAIKLGAGNYLTGSIQKYGNRILTLVKLIDTRNDEVIWTGKKEGGLEKLKEMADSLSTELKNFLEIKVLKQSATPEYGDINTESAEALRKYIEGMQLMMKGNFKPALICFEESFKLDTTFTFAALYAMYASSYSLDFKTSQKWTLITNRNRNRLPYDFKIWAELWEACYITRNCDSVLIFNDLLAQSEIKSRLFWYDIGYNYYALEKDKDAIRAFEKAELFSSEWGGSWKYADFYYYYGMVCHRAGFHEKEARIYEEGLKIFPENIRLIWGQARCAISVQDIKRVNELKGKLYEIAKNLKFSESDKEVALGDLYEEANFPDTAEIHYRKAVKLEPSNVGRMFSLASFLITSDRDISSGMKILDSIMIEYKASPNLLRIRGIGLCKQGKYKESYDLLKYWEGYREGDVWDFTVFGYLKEDKLALASHK